MPPPIHSTAGKKLRPLVVIVGAGHGGLEAARALRKMPVDVLLVDRRNYHKFQPLLYQVATAGLMVGNITQPVRHIFHGQTNVEFRLARVEGVDFEDRRLDVSSGPPIWYDYLILAAGASTAYFGVEGAREHAFPLKNIADALELRGHILSQFEQADCNPGLIEEGLLEFVIVGGGPTGVETAGALAELFEHVLRKDYPALDVDRVRITLVEMMDDVLPGYDGRLREYARKQLQARGVDVRLETAVERITPTEVRLKGGEVLPTRTLIWAAGVKANPLADVLGVGQARAGRVEVDERLQLAEHPEVFVVGDMAAVRNDDGAIYPQLAPVAIQQGIHAARNVALMIEGRDAQPFRYRDKGMMATIGRNSAVVQFPGGRVMRGRLAWFAWAFVHVVQLIGFRNQLGVLSTWAYNYFTWDRGPRLIIRVFPETDELEPDEREAETGYGRDRGASIRRSDGSPATEIRRG